MFATLCFSPSSTISSQSNSLTTISSLSQNQNQNQTHAKPSQFTALPSVSQSNGAIRMPTAPWMKGPLLLEPSEILNPSKPSNRKNRSNKGNDREKSDRALSGKESGVRGSKAMKKIIMKVENIKKDKDSGELQVEITDEFVMGDCLERIGDDKDEPKGRFGGKRMPWSRVENMDVFRRVKKEKVPTRAELELDKDLLERLRKEASIMRKWVKVKKAGVTVDVVDEIRSIWSKAELAMVNFDIPLCRNMDRAQEIIELKTGGLVIWRKKDDIVIYRGTDYHSRPKTFLDSGSRLNGDQGTSSLKLSLTSLKDKYNTLKVKLSPDLTTVDMCEKNAKEEHVPSSIFIDENDNQPVIESLYEREANRLLDGLGPRYIDWWMRKPLPVDADLLPEVVPGFMPPLRSCPPCTRPKLRDDELTYLRKLAYPLPFHFVLGRNRKLQGLAAAILKLWEKTLIAKIAVKWGVQNTDNKQMAYELKRLTGGVLLLRNKFLIILFRGKDFLPCEVAKLVVERERDLQICQLQEEDARWTDIDTFDADDEQMANVSSSGTLSEFQDLQSKYADLKTGNWDSRIQLEAEKYKLEKELKIQERKLFILNSKIHQASEELSRLNSKWEPAEKDADEEIMTYEERVCFQKMGIKLNGILVLGRRGVFDGVMEGLHQHWKHREVAKVITMQRRFSQVLFTARLLEAQSGGMLVSVDKLKEGHAIIIYRGKNYKRPAKLKTENLLNKQEALRRSLEMQRIGSLKFFAYQRQRAISDLKLKLAKLSENKEEYQEVSQIPN